MKQGNLLRAGFGVSAAVLFLWGSFGAAYAEKGKLEPFPKDRATSAIKGKVLFDGTPPQPKKLRIQGDEYCEQHAGAVASESLLVGEGGAIKNVFVYVKKGADQWAYEIPAEPVTVTQKGCVYTPHVAGILAGQKMKVTSDDDTTHNVHFVGQKNREWNLTQRKGQVEEKDFKRAEVGSSYLKCDIHSWMKCYVGIFYHPFFQVTGGDGAFSLGKLPPGTYEVEAWHEELGTQTQTVTLGEGEAKELTFSFKGK
jgi:plastocyanin